LNAASAAQFGFVVRAGTLGRGDGNGIIESWSYTGNTVYDWNQSGEPYFFWEDLSAARLIDATFTTASDAAGGANLSSSGTGSSNLNNYLPQAKLGNGNYIYVYSGLAYGTPAGGGPNYFGMSIIAGIDASGGMTGVSPPAATAPGLTVRQAYNIDQKIDDGYPDTGKVLTQYPGGPGSTGTPWPGTGLASWATSDSATTCFNTAGSRHVYSITYNNGTGLNCALSFKFQ